MWFILARALFPPKNLSAESKLESAAEDYVLVPVDKKVAHRKAWLLWGVSTVFYLTLVVGLSLGASDNKFIWAIFIAAVFMPIYLLFCRLAYDISKETFKTIPSLDKIVRDAEIKAENEKKSQEEFDLIFNSVWYIRYPIGITILLLLGWYLNSQEGSESHFAMWAIGILWGLIGAFMIREVVGIALIIGLIVIVGSWLLGAVASLSTSTAVIIGAIIIAFAIFSSRS